MYHFDLHSFGGRFRSWTARSNAKQSDEQLKLQERGHCISKERPKVEARRKYLNYYVDELGTLNQLEYARVINERFEELLTSLP